MTSIWKQYFNILGFASKSEVFFHAAEVTFIQRLFFYEQMHLHLQSCLLVLQFFFKPDTYFDYIYHFSCTSDAEFGLYP